MNTMMIATIQVNGGPIRRRVKPGPPEPPKAICEGCGHGLSYHDPNTQVCYEMVEGAPIKYDVNNKPTAHGVRQCTCRQYVGHLPYDQMLVAFASQPAPPAPLAEQSHSLPEGHPEGTA
jgi:hypothetical protein